MREYLQVYGTLMLYVIPIALIVIIFDKISNKDL